MILWFYDPLYPEAVMQNQIKHHNLDIYQFYHTWTMGNLQLTEICGGLKV